MTSAVVVSWTAPTVGTTPFTYQVQYSLNQSTWLTFGSTVATVTTTVTGLSDGTTYYFRVAAINSAGQGPYSSVANITTPSSIIAPGAPATITPSGATSSSIVASWTAPATGSSPFTYQLQTATTSGGPWNNFGSAISGLTTTVTGLAASTTYYFRVAAINSAGQGPYSTTASLATQATAGVAPTAPTALAASNPTSTAINLSWTAPTTGTAPLTYQPQYATASTGPWTSFGSPISTTAVTVLGLTSSTTYFFRVNAINAAGSGPFSSSVSMATTAAVTGQAPRVNTVSPNTVTSGGGTITLTGTSFTGSTMTDAGSGSQVPITVVNDTTITFTALSFGAGYFEQLWLTNPHGQSSRFSITYAANTTGFLTMNLIASTQVIGSTVPLNGYIYPVQAFSIQLLEYSDATGYFRVGSPFTVTPSTSFWTYDFVIPASTVNGGQYSFHLTSPAGADVFTVGFLPTSSLSAPAIGATSGASYVPGQTNVPPLPITGLNLTNVTSVMFGSVASPSFNVINSNSMTAVVPAQGYGLVNLTLHDGSGGVSNAVPFQYCHPVAEPIPVSIGGAAPAVPASWQGPCVAVNAPKAGQVTSVTVDPVHGNSSGTGSFGGNSALWSEFTFLNQVFGTGYPKLADGGTVFIHAGTCNMGPFARTWVIDFPGGINIIGVGADQVTLINTNAPGGQGLLVTHSNAYIYGCNFEMDGSDEPSGGYSAIRFYNDPVGPLGDGSSATNHFTHVEKVRFNQVEMGMVSGEAYTTVGENLTLFLKDVDFSLLIPDCYNSDWLSHEIYCGSQQFWLNCNAYGCKYGAIHKGRCVSMTLVGCWSRRTPNRWFDVPDGGVIRAYNCTFTEDLQADHFETTDTDLHTFEYCAAIVGYGILLSVVTPTFTNCDLWFSRLTNPSTGTQQGEDFLNYIGLPITFTGCRAHWSNQNNGDHPRLVIVDTTNFGPIVNGLVGIPTSNPTPTVWETLPALPAPRTP